MNVRRKKFRLTSVGGMYIFPNNLLTLATDNAPRLRLSYFENILCRAASNWGIEMFSFVLTILENSTKLILPSPDAQPGIPSIFSSIFLLHQKNISVCTRYFSQRKCLAKGNHLLRQFSQFDVSGTVHVENRKGFFHPLRFKHEVRMWPTLRFSSDGSCGYCLNAFRKSSGISFSTSSVSSQKARLAISNKEYTSAVGASFSTSSAASCLLL